MRVAEFFFTYVFSGVDYDGGVESQEIKDPIYQHSKRSYVLGGQERTMGMRS